MIKSSKAYAITCSLAYHRNFIVPAETLSEAAAKAEKIVHDLDEGASVHHIREAIEVMDWVEEAEENG